MAEPYIGDENRSFENRRPSEDENEFLGRIAEDFSRVRGDNLQFMLEWGRKLCAKDAPSDILDAFVSAAQQRIGKLA